MRVATFNLQNLRLRKRNGQPVLDGAADEDEPGTSRPIELAQADRVETARVIASAGADFVALQEVYDRAALDFFHHRFLRQAGARPYPHRFCIKGNDGRGLNVAALSRWEPVAVRSHAELTGAELGLADLPPDLRDKPIFRRDCLAVEFDAVTFFICHFKAPYPDAARALAVRTAEARAVRKIVESAFVDAMQARWIILGDFNEPAGRDDRSGSALAPLKSGFAVDLLDRLQPGTDWTYELPSTFVHSRPDRVLVSPLMAREYPDVRPEIMRSGMGAGPGTHRRGHVPEAHQAPHASDHALVYADFPGLLRGTAEQR